MKFADAVDRLKAAGYTVEFSKAGKVIHARTAHASLAVKIRVTDGEVSDSTVKELCRLMPLVRKI